MDLPNISVEEGVKHAARVILIAHGDNSNKDKDFELEMTWVRAADPAAAAGQTEGPVKAMGKHEPVPKELVEEAERQAREDVKGDEEDEKMEG